MNCLTSIFRLGLILTLVTASSTWAMATPADVFCFTPDARTRIDLWGFDRTETLEISTVDTSSGITATIAQFQAGRENLEIINDVTLGIADHSSTILNRGASIEGVMLSTLHAVEVSLKQDSAVANSTGEEFRGQLTLVTKNRQRGPVELKCFRWLND